MRVRTSWAKTAPESGCVAVHVNFTKMEEKTKLGSNYSILAFPFNLQERVTLSEGAYRTMELSQFCQSGLT